MYSDFGLTDYLSDRFEKVKYFLLSEVDFDLFSFSRLLMWEQMCRINAEMIADIWSRII